MIRGLKAVSHYGIIVMNPCITEPSLYQASLGLLTL